MPVLPPQLRQIDMDKSGAQVLRQEFNALRLDLVAGRAGMMGAPNLRIGTTDTNVRTDAFYFVDSGILELKAAVAAGTAFTATTHDIADPDASPREIIYVLSIVTGGVITITEGIIAVADAAVAPASPAGAVKLGEVKIQHDGSAIFNATTDALTAAHLTVTYTSADPEVEDDSDQLSSRDLTE